MKNSPVLAKCRGIYRHRKPPEDETGPRIEIDAWPHHWAADPRPNQGDNSLVLVRGSVLSLGASWYIPFMVIAPEYSSDVRKSLGSTYLLDDPLLGLHEIRD